MFKKIMAVLALLVAMVVIINTDWEVSHEVTIAASPSIVWSLLINAEGYAEWNRYSPNIKGRIAEGEVVWIEAHLDNEIRLVKNRVLSVMPEQELCWQSGGWYGYLARGTRCRWLSKTANGDTLLVHHEIMSGPLAWLIEVLYRERIERGIQLVDDSVAERAEALASLALLND